MKTSARIWYSGASAGAGGCRSRRTAPRTRRADSPSARDCWRASKAACAVPLPAWFIPPEAANAPALFKGSLPLGLPSGAPAWQSHISAAQTPALDTAAREGWPTAADGVGWDGMCPSRLLLREGKGCSHSKKPSSAQQPYQPCFKADTDCSSSCCLELEARNQTKPVPHQHSLKGPLKFHHQIPMACNCHPTPHEPHNLALTSSVRSLRSHLCKPRQPPAPQPIWHVYNQPQFAALPLQPKEKQRSLGVNKKYLK